MKPYTCYSTEARGMPHLYPAQDGWTADGRRKVELIWALASVSECRYETRNDDARCEGCYERVSR